MSDCVAIRSPCILSPWAVDLFQNCISTTKQPNNHPITSWHIPPQVIHLILKSRPFKSWPQNPANTMTPPPSPGPERSSNTTLANEDRPGSSGQASTLQPPNPKYDAYLSGATSEDEKKEPETNSSVKEEAPAEDDGIEYPTGLPFAFIVVALVLSIFLVSLDMVCCPPSGSCILPNRYMYLTRKTRLLSQLPYQGSQTSFKVSRMSPGTDQHFS